MIKKSAFLILAVVLALGGCTEDLMIENFNAEDLNELIENPTRSAVLAAATGMVIGARNEIDDRNGYVSLTGILGRESLVFDGSDPRFVSEVLAVPMSPGSRAFGGNIWPERYSNIRLGTLILNGTDTPPATDEMTDEEKEAVRGFVKTMIAHEFLLIINTRDENGAVIDVDRDPRGEPGPIVSKAEVFDHIETLLDDGRDHLDNAGSSAFSFETSSGFIGFNTPQTFRQFNRALAARVDVYTEDWMGAVSNLNESFLDTGAPLDVGVYHVFSLVSGDQTAPGRTPGNDLFDPTVFAHVSVGTDVETNGAGAADRRFQNKVMEVDPPESFAGITTDVTFAIYDNQLAPIPYIRNEELILLRAEANINLGNVTSGPNPAEDDINFIRDNSGGLDPVDLSAATIDELIDRIIYERRYSLMFEGGHRWIDARRLGRLDDLPLDVASHVRNSAFPIPEEECLARGQAGSAGGGCV